MRKATILLILRNDIFFGAKSQRYRYLAGALAIVLALICSIKTLFPNWLPLSIFSLGSNANHLQGKVIVIDPGHGGSDPGAKYKGLQEKNINLAISLKVADLLRKQGAKVTLTRTTDRDFYKSGISGTRREKKRSELNERVRLAESLKADIFLSIHANQDRHPNCYGMETFYHPQSNNGRQAAEVIQQELRHLQPRNKRVAKAGDYYLLRNTAMPALIVEVGFISHWEERTLLQKNDYQQSIANALLSGLNRYFSEVHSGNSVVNKPQTQNAADNSDKHVSTKENKVLELYFLQQSPEGDLLGMETRPISGSLPALTQPASSDYLQNGISAAVQELMKGPAQPGLEPIIPVGTELLDIEVKPPLVRLNFSKEFDSSFNGSLAEENNLLLSVYKTVTQFPGITELQILIEGQEECSPGGHLLVTAPIKEGQLERKVKIAIVIDDLGQNYPGTAEMLALPYPLTFAVMPNLENTRQEAKTAIQNGHQVIIHMPMAPDKGLARWLGPGAITLGLNNQEITERIRQAIIQMPQAVGLSNHTGSKITADRAIMQVILAELKAHKMFILDSRTTEKTVIPELAKQMGLPWAQRTVFLDNVNSYQHIRKQLDLLSSKALESGEAIGIGHVGTTGQAMSRALQDYLPLLKARGIVVVPVSELIKNH